MYVCAPFSNRSSSYIELNRYHWNKLEQRFLNHKRVGKGRSKSSIWYTEYFKTVNAESVRLQKVND